MIALGHIAEGAASHTVKGLLDVLMGDDLICHHKTAQWPGFS